MKVDAERENGQRENSYTTNELLYYISYETVVHEVDVTNKCLIW